MAKFDFNQKKMSVFQKFVTFLNEVTDEMHALENVVEPDKMDVGKPTVRYHYDDEFYYSVTPDGDVLQFGGEKIHGDTELQLINDVVLIVKNGKFAGTRNGLTKDSTVIPSAEVPPIAQSAETPNQQEEIKQEAVEEPTAEEKEEEISQSSEEHVEEVVATEEITQESVEIDYNEVTEEIAQSIELPIYKVGDVEYRIEQSLIDHINSIIAEKEALANEKETLTVDKNALSVEVAQLKQRIPTAEHAVIVPVQMNKEEKKDEKVNMYNAVNLFKR